MKILHYFAYGSNMNCERVVTRGLDVVSVQGGTLLDYRLVFDKVAKGYPGEGHANIIYAPGERVEGVVHELAADDEILKMDPFELAPVNYGRDVVRLIMTGEGLWAWTYFANVALRRDGCLPTRAYLDHLLAGQRFLTPEYFNRLRQLKLAKEK